MHSLFWGQNYAAIHHCANSKNAICTSPPSIARFQEGRMEKNQPWNICTEGSEKMEDEEGAYGSRGRGRGRSCGASRRPWGWRSPRGGGARRRPRRRPGRRCCRGGRSPARRRPGRRSRRGSWSRSRASRSLGLPPSFSLTRSRPASPVRSREQFLLSLSLTLSLNLSRTRSRLFWANPWCAAERSHRSVVGLVCGGRGTFVISGG